MEQGGRPKAEDPMRSGLLGLLTEEGSRKEDAPALPLKEEADERLRDDPAAASPLNNAREASLLTGMTPARLRHWAGKGWISEESVAPHMFSFNDMAFVIAVRLVMEEEGLPPSQAAQRASLRLREAEGILRRGGWAWREIPDLENISVDPRVLSGVPAIRGRRIHAMFVGAEGRTSERRRRRLICDYRLTEKDVFDAVRWREKVLSYQRAGGDGEAPP